MASIAPAASIGVARDDRRFFLGIAIAMALANVLGFGTQFAMGRSTVHAPPLVHLHALVFVGWVGFFVYQSWAVAAGRVADHRRLGRIGAWWALVMVAVGIAAMVRVLRAGTVPFFFTPAYFMAMSALSVIGFAVLLWWAIALRHRTEWHRRLVMCAMTAIMGPALGRLIPAPLLIPYAGWAMFAATMLFPLAGMLHDLHHRGSVHRAWWYGAVSLVVLQVTMHAIAAGPVGAGLYALITSGAPGAAIAPLAYPAPPPMG